MQVHIKSRKHKKAVFHNSLEYECYDEQEDRDNYRVLMEQIRNYYYEKRIDKKISKNIPLKYRQKIV
jgi:hypothetical protein